MKDADTMGESSVGSTRKDELREAELSNPAKPLERRSLNDAPKRVLKLVRAKLDKVMERISDPLWPEAGQYAFSEFEIVLYHRNVEAVTKVSTCGGISTAACTGLLRGDRCTQYLEGGEVWEPIAAGAPTLMGLTTFNRSYGLPPIQGAISSKVKDLVCAS